MMIFDKKRLETILSNFKGRKILVLGDLMLDEYLWGSVTRISPEAPVPVVEVTRESARPGGAANVAWNLTALGALPVLVGVIGNDRAGEQLIEELKLYQIPSRGIFKDRNRSTTVKTRIIAHHQHVVRADRELKEDISVELEDRILEFLDSEIEGVEAILIEDYNKGVLTREVIRRTIQRAKDLRKIITVDPKFNNFFEFKGVTLFKPNQREVEAILGIKIEEEEDLIKAGKTMVERLDGASVLLTQGEQGMTLFENSGKLTHIPTVAREVFDVSGAGDTAIATLTLSLTAGANLREASFIANYAAGIEVGKVGIVAVSYPELLQTIRGVEGE